MKKTDLLMTTEEDLAQFQRLGQLFWDMADKENSLVRRHVIEETLTRMKSAEERLLIIAQQEPWWNKSETVNT